MIFAILLTLIVIAIIGVALAAHTVKAKNAAFERIAAFFAIQKVDDHYEMDQIAGLWLSAAADLFGERLKASLKGQALNAGSQVARIEKAMRRDLGKDAINQQAPVAGLIFDQLPIKWQDKILDNPFAAQAAMNIFAQMGGAAPDKPTNGQAADFTKQLGKWG